MRLEEFDYPLPSERIAQRPLDERDASRLMVVDRAAGTFLDRTFRELPQLLRTGEYYQSQVAEEHIQALRELTNLRYEFVKERKNLQRQVYSLLSLTFPEYEKTVIAKPSETYNPARVFVSY